MNGKVLVGLLGSLTIVCLNSNVFVYAMWWVLGTVGILSLAILFRVALFKEPTFRYPTALLHYILHNVMYTLGAYNHWKERWDLDRLKEVQDNVLKSILKLNGQTIYGRKHNLAEVQTRQDFVKTHPVTSYDHYREYVERMANGEKNILTKEDVVFYGATSGTTGQPSIIPLTKSLLQTHVPYLAMVNRIVTKFLPIRRRYQRNLRLFYNPSRLLKKTPSGILMGPLTAQMQTSIMVRRDTYTTPPEGFEIADNRAAEYVHVLFALRHRNLPSIEAVFVSLVYFAFRAMEQNWREMVMDVRQGTLDRDLKIPDEIRSDLVKRLNPMPDRANELEREFLKGFDNIATRIWPKLVLINSIASGSFQQYAILLKERFTKEICIYTPYYASTEGVIGYNHWPECSGDDVHFLLAARALFFEFLPLENVDDKDPKTLFADEVEKGKVYHLIITNHAGLFRYRLGDVIRVVDFYHQYPLIHFLHRSSQQLNIRGEKVSEDILLSAVTHLNALFSAQHNFSRITDFTSCESVLLNAEASPGKGAPFYVLFLELQGTIEANRQKLENELGMELEQYLIENQSEGFGYKYQRDKGGLASAKVLLVAPGTFQRLREYILNRSSTSPSQLKVPRVLTKQVLVDFICSASVF